MAEIIEDFGKITHGGKKNKYPYDEWFDGQVRKLTRGTDFDVVPMNFVQCMLQAAYRRRVVLKIRRDGNIVIMQATGKI